MPATSLFRETRTRRIRIVVSVIMALMLGVAGCGDDGAQDGAEEPPPETAEGGGVDDRCSGTDLEFTNHETGESGTATNALATSEADGAIYVSHAADFDITPDDLVSWRPEVPEGGNVLTVQLTSYNVTEDLEPVQEGAELQWTTEPGELTYVVRHFTIDEDWSNVEVTGDEIDETGGELTVTSTGDTFCFEIDYQDPQKSISGTVEAPVFE